MESENYAVLDNAYSVVSTSISYNRRLKKRKHRINFETVFSNPHNLKLLD